MRNLSLILTLIFSITLSAQEWHRTDASFDAKCYRTVEYEWQNSGWVEVADEKLEWLIVFEAETTNPLNNIGSVLGIVELYPAGETSSFIQYTSELETETNSKGITFEKRDIILYQNKYNGKWSIVSPGTIQVSDEMIRMTISTYRIDYYLEIPKK
jgi:hypothetical protein